VTADPLAGLHDDLGVLAVALTARDRAADQAAARKAAVTAVESVDSMLRSLYLIRGRLVREISTALATSLFGDLAAGLYEDVSARLLEHPALLRLLNLEPIPPCGSVPPVSLIRPVEVPGIAVLLH
jgi:formate dehydrogenase maturation protein FdhE